MFETFNRKIVLANIDELISKGYGAYTDLINLTIQEISDIFKVRDSIKQEQMLNGMA
jgi:hypothetical protein